MWYFWQTNSDFDAKPMVMLLGQYSTGKTTFIKHLLKTGYPGKLLSPYFYVIYIFWWVGRILYLVYLWWQQDLTLDLSLQQIDLSSSWYYEIIFSCLLFLQSIVINWYDKVFILFPEDNINVKWSLVVMISHWMIVSLMLKGQDQI